MHFLSSCYKHRLIHPTLAFIGLEIHHAPTHLNKPSLSRHASSKLLNVPPPAAQGGSSAKRAACAHLTEPPGYTVSHCNISTGLQTKEVFLLIAPV